MKRIRMTGARGGQSIPLHGGSPRDVGCGDCTDGCHLPKVSITVEELTRVTRRYVDIPGPLGELIVRNVRRNQPREPIVLIFACTELRSGKTPQLTHFGKGPYNRARVGAIEGPPHLSSAQAGARACWGFS